MSNRFNRSRVRFAATKAVLETLEQRKLLSGNLVVDVGGIYPTDSVMLNGESFFTADDGVHGRELWVSDGTPDGTRMVKDITPGGSDSTISNLSSTGTHVMFILQNGSTDSLWRSDGTAAGTVQVSTIGLPGHQRVFVSGVADGHMIFVVDRPNGTITGNEKWDWQLWSSDGTAAGTGAIQSVTNIRGGDFSDVEKMYEIDQHVVFTSYDGQLWSSDGTSAGTFAIHSGYITSDALCNLNGKLVFPDDGKLWSTDGTIAGTSAFSDLSGGNFVQFGDKLLFEHIFNNDDGDQERWLGITDGTAQGTELLARSPGGPWCTTWGVQLGDKFIVPVPWSVPGAGLPADNYNELWVTDGTPEGTNKYFDIPHNPEKIIPQGNFASVGGLVFFRTSDLVNDTLRNTKVWQTDGTSAGTKIVETAPAGALNLDEANGLLIVHTTSGRTYLDPSTLAAPSGPSDGSFLLDNGTLRVRGTQNADVIRVYHHLSADGRFVVSLNGVKKSFAFSAVKRIKIYGYSGDDKITFTDAYGRVSERTAIWAGAGNDRVSGSVNRDTIYGESGDDTIGGGKSDDVVQGGNGDDDLNGGIGADIVSGENGSDHLNGGGGADIVSGGNDGSPDFIDGGAGVDVLFGQAVVDTFFSNTKTGDTVLEDILES